MALRYEQYLNYAGGLQVITAAPLDIRTVVADVTALTTPATWYKDGKESTGTSIIYNGLIVYVESEQCAYVCVNSAKVTNLSEGWKKIGSDVELSGAAVEIVEVAGKYYESTDTEHKNEITVDAVTTNGTGRYLKLTIAQSDVIYIPAKNLVDLSNYYTKNEVETMLLGINQFSYEIVDELPTASKDTMYILYLLPDTTNIDQTTNVYDQYITVSNNSSTDAVYTWEKIGDTRIDLSDINSSINNINASINNINTSINTINSSITSINTSINNINTSINTINSSITNINTSINDIYSLAKGAINDISTRTNTTLATLIENSSDNKSDITLTLTIADGSTAGTGLATNTYVDQKFEWVSIDGEQTT